MNTTGKGNDKDSAGSGDRPLSFAEASARIFAEQAASMAAMTAFGLTMTSRMTGIFMGAVADAIEKTPEKMAESENPVERMAKAPSPSVVTTSRSKPEIKLATSTPAAKAEPEKPVLVKAAQPVAKSVKKAVVETKAVKSSATKTALTKAPASKPALKTAQPTAKVVELRPAAKPATPVQAKVEPAPKAAPAKSNTAKKPVSGTASAEKAARLPANRSKDDLKQISGVGPRLEKTLNDMGITSFAQIAAWKPKEIQKFDTELGLDNRIVRDDWIGQVKKLLQEGS